MATVNYGTVNHNGETITLTEQASLTNRVFCGWYNDAVCGETYTAEYKASGESEGSEVNVIWHFEVVKGEEPEDESDYPFDDAHVWQVLRD